MDVVVDYPEVEFTVWL